MPDRDRTGEALARLREAPAWHRVTATAEHDIFTVLDVSARCSCGDNWDRMALAIGHAYAANAVLEAALTEEMAACLRECEDWMYALIAVVGEEVAHSKFAAVLELRDALAPPETPGEEPKR